MNFFRIILIVTLFAYISTASGQSNIPIGTWRAHLSFKQINSVAVTTSYVYAASGMGVMIFDRSDNSISSLNKLNGLSSSGISAIAYDTDTEQLLILYEDGNIDLVKESTVTNIRTLRDSDIVGSKRLNHALINNGIAYVATDYGIALLDLNTKAIREIWQDLGEDGSKIRINNSVILGDSIFAATSRGIISGNLSDNLLDFHFWVHANEGELNRNVEAITIFQNHIYAAVDTTGIFKKQGKSFEKLPFLTDVEFNHLTASLESLLIATPEALWTYSGSSEPTQVVHENIQRPAYVIAESNSIYWIGDLTRGLVSNVNGAFEQFLLNGPTVEDASKLRFTGGKLFALKQISSNEEQDSDHEINFFENGLWNVENRSISNITDVVLSNEGTEYISSFGHGLLSVRDDQEIKFNETNSPLQSNALITEGIVVHSILNSEDGLWVLNYGVQPFLHLLKPDGTWSSFTSSNFFTQYALDFVMDDFGYFWLRIDPNQGGGLVVFDPETLTSNVRNNTIGTGGLLNNSVLSLALDRDSYVWAGTTGGLGYFYSPNEDAVSPIFEGRFLLRDERITDIEVDGGNRKWIGTENGAWLFDPTGENLILNFNEENSPLLSNIIRDIEIDPSSGEVFFATSKGIISYRGDATASSFEFKNVKIFPNPVVAAFQGSIGIEGLATDAIVKITDVSGKLVWQGQANGGTASWGLRSYDGKRAASGIYLVFASTPDGKESVVGKLAIIE